MMLASEEALQIVLGFVRTLGLERVELADALGRIPAEDIESDVDMPPLHRAVKDGYVCRRVDLRDELSVAAKGCSFVQASCQEESHESTMQSD